MALVGIDHPNTLDLLTESGTKIRLVLVEERALMPEDARALQEKLNNYLSYAIDGELYRQHPKSHGKFIIIRIDLYATPAEFIVQFLRSYREAIARFSVDIEIAVNGNLLL